MPELDVVFVDDHLIILNKPSGLLSVPGRGEDKQDCLIARAQSQWPEALTVHRLDMATSGLMVIARGPETQRKLSHAFESEKLVNPMKRLCLACFKQREQTQQKDGKTFKCRFSLIGPTDPKAKLIGNTGNPAIPNGA